MSRSYKKNAYARWVCMSTREVKEIKNMANRRYRHRLNRGVFDEDARSLVSYKREEETSWTYDLGKGYMQKKHYPEEYYNKFLRK